MRQRLDTLLVEKKLVKSRSQAADLIKRGKVSVSGKIIIKSSTLVEEDTQLNLDIVSQFTSRGGLKLEHALKVFDLNVQDKTCLDVGSSTGGFTDCLLQHGAHKVYAVDVGTLQFDIELRKNPRVILFEKTDIRNLTLPELVDITVIDVSFISLSLVLKDAINLTKKDGDIVALIKPQFEVGKEALPKTGVVVDPLAHKNVIEKIRTCGESLGLLYRADAESPIVGGSGNKEFLIHFKT